MFIMEETIKEYLQPIANWFNTLGTPEPIVHWGHPLMMGIVVFAMGSFVGLTGWRSRIVADQEKAQGNRDEHRKIAPWLFLFIALGYTGGVLSLLMQGQPILESSHFWTGSSAILLLGLNGLISLSGFGGGNPNLRTVHAYLGSIALIVLLVHAALGFQLGLSI
jgi:fucose 4-O-acetylase-like acetyltransferase